MDDANKVLRITMYLKSIWPSDKIGYEFLPKKALHKFAFTTKYLKQAVYISADYLSDHRLSVMLKDMDTRHVEDIIKSNDNPEIFFLGYTSNGRVIFSVRDNEKSVGVGNA